MLGRRVTSKIDGSVTIPPFPLPQCLAKSRKVGDAVCAGRTVLDHCLIVGNVAKLLVQRMPVWLREALFPDGAELVAAVHDIGKVSPTFQKKIYECLTVKDPVMLEMLKGVVAALETQWGGHAGVSQATLSALLGGEVHIPKIAGKHHGYMPNLGMRSAGGEAFGGEAWEEQRRVLVGMLQDGLAAQFPTVYSHAQAQVLAGLTTVADWIGSSWWFENPEDAWEHQIAVALDAAGYVPPTITPHLSFEEVFGFAPKDTQTTLIESVQSSGVYILEAPMGLGKTEAALYAAYQLLAKNLATGIYFALPTQLTSNKIHERFGAFLSCILAEDSAHPKALLLHSNAWLTQHEMGEEGNPGGAWFSHSKRGILAPFAVGTIDQALMAVMNVKHGFVRTFGLAGKVVILDEVHSYDSYTGTILNDLVQTLRQLHCTVIILSATLTSQRRAQLLGEGAHASAYPLISAQPREESLQEKAVTTLPDVAVTLHITDAPAALEEALLRAEQGQQVLWIENTVQEAQARYQQCAARMAGTAVACGLLHSRFITRDRATNETQWIGLYGKDGGDARQAHGRILIGTQVVEQSIDIDADFLVTRVAPSDMLLQRMGRLWRHNGTRRPDGAVREAWIIAPSLHDAVENPEAHLGVTALVYDPYVLCRSVEIWQALKVIHLPSDIRHIMEATYAPRPEQGNMAKYLAELEKKREKLQSLARVGLTHGGQSVLPEEKASTRYNEQETTDVLLLRAFQHDAKQRCTDVTLLSGEVLRVPHNGRSLPRKQWREVAASLMENTVKVAIGKAPDAVRREELTWLGDYFYLGRAEYDETCALRVGIVGDDGVVRSIHRTTANQRHRITYNATLGYHCTPHKQEKI